MVKKLPDFLGFYHYPDHSRHSLSHYPTPEYSNSHRGTHGGHILDHRVKNSVVFSRSDQVDPTLPSALRVPGFQMSSLCCHPFSQSFCALQCAPIYAQTIRDLCNTVRGGCCHENRRCCEEFTTHHNVKISLEPTSADGVCGRKTSSVVHHMIAIALPPPHRPQKTVHKPCTEFKRFQNIAKNSSNGPRHGKHRFRQIQ